MNMKRHALTDEQWEAVQSLIPKSTARTGRRAKEPRLMLDGIFWILSTGAPWRDLPERFGPWQTVYDHFRKWRKAGVFAAMLETLQVKLDGQGLIDWELWCVDGAVVRASRAAAGAEKKVSPCIPSRGLSIYSERRLHRARVGVDRHGAGRPPAVAALAGWRPDARDTIRRRIRAEYITECERRWV